MNAGRFTPDSAGSARLLTVLIASILVAAAALAGCGNDEEAQRTADTMAYHSEPGSVSGTGEPVETPAEGGVVSGPSTVTETPAVAGSGGDATTAEAERPETTTTETPAAPVEPVDYSEAEALYHQGRYNEASDAFLAYTTQRPGNAWGFYMLGLSHWKANRPVEAEESLARALELDPENPKVRLNLARVLLDENRPADALPEARRVTETAPEAGEGYRVLGRAFHNLNRNEEAIDAYRTAIRRNPRDVWAMNNLALIYIQQERFEDALPPLARAVSLRDDLAVVQNNLGVALERTGRFAAAGSAYRAALAADSEHRRASESLARIEGIPDETGFDETGLAELAARFVESLEEPRAESTPLRPRAETTGDETAAVEGSQLP